MTTPALIGSSGDSLREAFGKALVQLADQYPFVVFDGDVAGGTGVHHFRKAYPNRFFQCGIAEQNMMSLAAGFNAQTNIPCVVTSFAVFHMRAIEQARLSIAYAKRNVKIVASHPGLDVGPDGASAQCLEDLAMFRSIPNMAVLSPVDPHDIEQATEALLAHEGPVYMRTGRSNASRFLPETYRFEWGQGFYWFKGKDVTLISCGSIAYEAYLACEEARNKGCDCGLLLLPSLKPLDRPKIAEAVALSGALVTVEDHSVIGGLGSAVAEAVSQSRPCPIEMVGVHDRFGESGEGPELRAAYGLTKPSILKAILRVLERKNAGS